MPVGALKLESSLRGIIGCALIAGLLLSAACAQRYSFTEAATGLDNLNVDCVAQDSAGYMWVGTENGLYQYDGSQFSKIGPSRGLYARTIQDILAGPNGTLLVGTTEGVFFRGANGNFTEIRPPDPTSRFSLRIGSVFTESATGHFIVTDRTGVYELSQDAPGHWNSRALLLGSAPVWSVLYDRAGTIWLGCGDDLCRLQTGSKLEHMGAALHLPAERWLHLRLDGRGRLWLRGGTHVGEIDLAAARYTERPLPGQPNSTPYDALSIDAAGHILASQGASFGIWMGDHWRMVTQRNGLSRYDISALVVDREGSIWIGVVGHGLVRWVGQDCWEAYTAADGLSDDIVWSSLRDHAGRLWIATESGLDWLAKGSNTIQHWHSPSIPSVRAISLALDGQGNIWMGTGNGALVRIDTHSLAGRAWAVPEVYRLLHGPGSELWIATNQGLYQLDTSAASPEPRLVTDPAIANPRARFRDLCFDPQGFLWAASDEALFRLGPKGWARIDPGLSGIIPHEIVADRRGNLWAAGLYAGLMRLRVVGNKVVESEHILRPHLLSEQVVSLAIDSRGWLWVGQDAGVTVFDGQTWRSFTQTDGLVWNDTDTYALNEDSDGSLWIGTSGGISHLLKPNAVPLIEPNQPTIQQIAFGSTPVSSGSTIPWSASPLTITMAALNFRDANHIRIRYRLLGLEADWIETADETLHYARLEPGHYIFQAETADVTGSRVSPVIEIEFRILPRWWQTWQFQLALVLAGILMLTLLWHWRIHLLVWQKRQLQEAVLDRTQELEREKTQLLQAREQMRHYAEHDGLSGLLNHRVIIDRLQGEIDRSQRESTPLSIIMVDLDHFKIVNDTYGHQAGDAVLKQISLILQRSIRSYDWAGRYGGEEFLLILPGSSFTGARLRAEQMRQAIQAAEIVHEDHVVRISASFGVASGFPTATDAMIRVADSALYRAKNNGRNCVVAQEMASPSSGA